MHQAVTEVELPGAHMRVESGPEFSRVALFLPGISGGVMTDRFLPLAEMLKQEEWALARPEIWKDAEDANQKTLAGIHEAVRAALDELEEEGYLEIVAIGKSFGGGVLLSLVDVRLSKKILWAPAIGCGEEGNLTVMGDVKLGSVQSPLDIKIPHTQIALDPSEIVIIHGTEDSIIPIENSESILKQCGKKVTAIEGADHSFKVKAHEEALLAATKVALA